MSPDSLDPVTSVIIYVHEELAIPRARCFAITSVACCVGEAKLMLLSRCISNLCEKSRCDDLVFTLMQMTLICCADSFSGPMVQIDNSNKHGTLKRFASFYNKVF